MAWEYSKQVKALFQNAMEGNTKSHIGEIENPDGVGQHGSIVCGDAITFYLKVEKAENPINDRIIQVRYKTFGCTSAIASSEALCELIEQKQPTPIEALKITNKEIVEYLGGLPEQKIHCSVMGAEVLQDAISSWAKSRGVNLGLLAEHEEDEEGEIVCECFNLSKNYIEKKVKELKLQNINEIKNAIKAGGACGACHFIAGGLEDILKNIHGETKTTPKEKKSGVIIEGELKAFIANEFKSLTNGEHPLFTLLKVKENKIYLAVKEGADLLLIDQNKKEIEAIFKHKVSNETVVIDV